MSLYRSRGLLSLCVLLSVALAVLGAPASRSPNLHRSEGNSAPIHPQSSGKVKIPILPPDENMDTMTLERARNRQEFDFVSGGAHSSGFEPEDVSGDNSAEYPDYLIPGPVDKPTIFEDVKPESEE